MFSLFEQPKSEQPEWLVIAVEAGLGRLDQNDQADLVSDFIVPLCVDASLHVTGSPPEMNGILSDMVKSGGHHGNRPMPENEKRLGGYEGRMSPETLATLFDGCSILMETLGWACWALLNRDAPAWQRAASHDLTVLPEREQSLVGQRADQANARQLAFLVRDRALPALARRFPKLVLQKEKCRFSGTGMPISLPCDCHARSRKTTNKMCEVKTYASATTIATDDRLFGPPDMVGHLELLDRHSDHDLSVALRVARNAMFFMSGPRHGAVRKLVTGCLGNNRIRAWEPVIERAIETALDRLEGASAPDLVAHFSEPLFRLVTKPIMGIAPENERRFDELAPILQDILEPMLSLRDLLRLQDIFAEALEMIGTQGPFGAHEGPQPVLQTLLESDLEAFDREDCIALVLVLYGASFNISHTIANILQWILTLPAEARKGVADDGWIAERLEHIIPLCASPKYIYRMARTEAEVDDLTFARRDTAQLHLSAVNHGVSTGHLAFGHGLHRCVGASLSRLMIRKAVPALFSRFPALELDPMKHAYFNYSQTVALQSLRCRPLKQSIGAPLYEHPALD